MPGVEISSGSLGHGLSIAVGAALGGKVDNAEWDVYCIISDGELMEGSTWEAIMSAGHFGLNNLTVVVDRNNYTIDGSTEENMSLDPLDEKFRAFHWDVVEIDGHNIEEIYDAFNQHSSSGKPKVIIANTIKGRGVPSLEGKASSHFFKMGSEDAQAALDLLGEN
jgi:transketolase